MADISTAVSRARVPILGEDGRISDDYIPKSIPQSVEAAEQAARDAAGAASQADGSAKAAADSASAASGSERAAKGSADAAGKSAEAAKGSADAASGSASQAATSADEAASSATKAAQSAEQVADKYITGATATTLEPGEQATAQVVKQVLQLGIPQGEKGDKGDTGTGVPDGGEPGQLLSKTDSGTAWVDPPSGNVLKGELGPDPLLSADDAYATKPRRLTVYGATRQNLWVNPSGSANGVTATSNADGSVTLSGTASKAATIELVVYTLQPGKTYTLSVDKAIPGVGEGYGFYVDTDVQESAYVGNATRLSASYTINTSATRVVVGVRIASGTAVSGTYRIMLNEGSTAQPWCPPGLNSVDELSLVTAGKNLLKINSDLQTKTTGGMTFTPNEDGTVTVDGTSTGTSDYYLLGISWANRADNYLPGQEMVFSSNARAKLCGFDSSGSGSFYAILNGGNQIISAEQITKTEKLVCFLSYGSGQGETNKKVYAQLELGSTATDYEPPQVTTTPIDLDGNSLRSLPDGTCDELTIDATGAVTLTQRVGARTFDGSETIELPSVTLPTLPAPTVNVFADAESSGTGYAMAPDVGMEYERNVTVAFDKLQAQVSALNVLEATND